jgi:hypothetical protein
MDTRQKLKELGQSVVDDIKGAARAVGDRLSEIASDAGDSAAHKTAELSHYVRSKGGIGAMVNDIFTQTAGYAGRAAGTVARGAKAGVKAIDDVLKEPGVSEPATVEQTAGQVWDMLKQRYQANYSASTIDPEVISQTFQKAAGAGAEFMQSFYAKIRAGTDRVSKQFTKEIPESADYQLTLGSRTYTIGRTLYTKSAIKKARDYLTRLDGTIPTNLKGRQDLFTLIAAEGIGSEHDFRTKLPDTYKALERYFVWKK